jgi:hypothetical protein
MLESRPAGGGPDRSPSGRSPSSRCRRPARAVAASRTRALTGSSPWRRRHDPRRPRPRRARLAPPSAPSVSASSYPSPLAIRERMKLLVALSSPRRATGPAPARPPTKALSTAFGHDGGLGAERHPATARQLGDLHTAKGDRPLIRGDHRDPPPEGLAHVRQAKLAVRDRARCHLHQTISFGGAEPFNRARPAPLTGLFGDRPACRDQFEQGGEVDAAAVVARG